MRSKNIVRAMATLFAGVVVTARLLAAEKEHPSDPRPVREEPPSPINNPVPEERAARIRDSRARQGGAVSNRLEWEKRREEWRNLSPEEREARLKVWRERWSTNRPNLKAMSPEEREAKRQEMRARFDKRFQELRQKKADGTLTVEEQRRLDRMEEIFKRFKQSNPGAESRPLSPERFQENQPGKPSGNK